MNLKIARPLSEFLILLFFYVSAIILSPAVQAAEPEWLAQTLEIDLTDPDLAQKAAELGNDSQRIFVFVRDEIAYEVYTGSLRGARGTLWSKAGNALDQASLLIALLRIAGVPARYAQGQLDVTQAQQLVQSMFMPPLQVLGCPPEDMVKADPVNDPALIAEAQQHFWVEADTGGGLHAFDPSFASAQSGHTFTGARTAFFEVPDSLRHTLRIRLEVETGGGIGRSIQSREVLNETLITATLSGRPLTLGHFTDSHVSGGMLGSTFSHTYSPYLLIGGNDASLDDDELRRGEDYQELSSSTFGPLSQQMVSSRWLSVYF